MRYDGRVILHSPQVRKIRELKREPLWQDEIILKVVELEML